MAAVYIVCHTVVSALLKQWELAGSIVYTVWVTYIRKKHLYQVKIWTDKGKYNDYMVSYYNTTVSQPRGPRLELQNTV